tara:strand:+ start:553 stop:804 length:252 start_codon:yes stop_codon:yes gene_type:complete
MNYLDSLRNLNDKTAVLESLGWDEAALAQLISFIDLQKECFTPTHPKLLLDQITEFFGEETRIVLESIFNREMIKLQEKIGEN